MVLRILLNVSDLDPIPLWQHDDESVIEYENDRITSHDYEHHRSECDFTQLKVKRSQNTVRSGSLAGISRTGVISLVR